ncbi:serine/threonine protein kinase [Trypanosoma theileri]|uniref:Serine/threonine protein kinase n=1 Tax=Trypanosoma theileri TaxID=67003 RepID=A0A1X0NYQ8_9TRYP|nr:serine/threonine protein kinase [Trypanosoma theileri]ORC89349.1 serine/threonine protein kinase [Trypanosoma theileri]
MSSEHSKSRSSSSSKKDAADKYGTVQPLALAGYTHLRRISSSNTHETLVAQSLHTKELAHIRVFALGRLRKNPQLRDSLERWALVGRTARHPNIVKGMSSFVSASDLFLVEEHCMGGELFSVLDAYYRSGATIQTEMFPCISLEFVRCVMRDVMSAVEYLHTTCGVVHRGIKLESIFLDANNRAKLGRFGMCAAIPNRESNDGMLQLCVASKHYAAPELVMGHLYKGELIDVWAAGVVLFVMLTGRFPFTQEEGDEKMLFERICTADEVLLTHPALAAVSDPLAVDLVRNMLRVNPQCRLTVNEVLQHPFLSIP